MPPWRWELRMVLEWFGHSKRSKSWKITQEHRFLFLEVYPHIAPSQTTTDHVSHLFLPALMIYNPCIEVHYRSYRHKLLIFSQNFCLSAQMASIKINRMPSTKPFRSSGITLLTKAPQLQLALHKLYQFSNLEGSQDVIFESTISCTMHSFILSNLLALE